MSRAGRKDTIALAALWRTLARRLYRNPWINWDLNAVSRAIVVENKWRAQRHGIHGTFVNVDGSGATPVAEMLDQLIEEITPDAESLGCLAEVKHCRAIIDAGTSADAQLAVFKDKESSAPPDVALRAVTGRQPPRNTRSPELSTKEAVAWAAIGGATVQIVRTVARRGAASYWLKSTGGLPPGMKSTKDAKR